MPAVKTRFDTTQWSLVLAAREKASPQAEEALADVLRAYWGKSPPTVEDSGKVDAEVVFLISTLQSERRLAP